MSLKKYGTGKVLPEDEQEQKTAKANWTEEDQKELEQENQEADKDE